MSVIATRDQVPQIVRGHAPAVSKTPAAGAGLSGRDMLRALRKRWKLILIIVAVFGSLAAGGTKLWLMYAPYYTADGYIEVTNPRGSPFESQALAPQEIMDRRVTQLARLIARETVLEQALQDDRIKSTKWFEMSKVDAPKRLEKDIDVVPMAKTSLIRVSMTGRNREELADIVNAVMQAAVDEAVKFTARDRAEEIKRVDDELLSINGKLGEARKEYNLLTVDATLSGIRGRRETLSIQMSNLIPELTKLIVAQAQADEALRMAKQMVDTPGMFESSAEAQQMLDSDGTLRSLKMAEANWSTELDGAMSRYGERHQMVMKLKDKLTSVRNQIRDYTERILGDYKKAYIQMREMQLNAITAQLVKVRTEYNGADATGRDLATRELKIGQLEIAMKDFEETVRTLTRHRMDTLMLVTLDPPAKLRSMARPPNAQDPSMPKWGVTIPLGVFIGLALALALAFTLEFIDTSIKGPSDITRRIDLPMLGMVPHSDDMEEEIPDLRLAFASHPNSLISEAFRQVRTCLLFSGPAEGRRSLLVASSLPEDGRTTVSLNLAAAMARGGRKVLVVDANFRQPMIRRLFPQAPEHGLSNALVDHQIKWQELVVQVEPNFFVMSSGQLPPNPAELLGSEEMRQIIGEMIAEYDQVIFDSAPCLVVSDSAILATLVDGVIMTVRAGANTYGLVHRSREMLTRVGARIVGVVLNGVRVTAGGYLRKNYETFYEYHTQAAPRLPG